MAIPTLCADSSRRSAVTTISSRPLAAAAGVRCRIGKARPAGRKHAGTEHDADPP